MKHEIKKSETLVTLTMTEREFRDLYDNFPSRFDSDTTEEGKKIDKELCDIIDEL